MRSPVVKKKVTPFWGQVVFTHFLMVLIVGMPIGVNGQSVNIVPSGNTTLCQGSTISLLADTIGFTPNAVISWSPASGLSCISCDNPTATINDPSITYTVTVSDNSNTYSDQIQLMAQNGFQLPQTIFSQCLGNSQLALFNFMINNLAQNPNSNVLSYSIDWGDGSVIQSFNSNAAISNAIHQYNAQGLYNLVITAFGANGCNFADSFLVTNVLVPGGSLTSPAGLLVCVGQQIKLPSDVDSANLNQTIYSVSFGDGYDTIYQHPLPDTVCYTYDTTSCTSPGSVFEVDITVTTGGCSSLGSSNNIRVLAPPIADFSVSNIAACVGDVVNFTNQTQNGYGNNCFVDNGSTTWDFGDGTTSTLNSPTHIYTTPGTYIVELEVESSTACDSTTYHYDTICIQAPLQPQFTLNTNGNCLPVAVTTNNTSVGSICGLDDFNWSLNQGQPQNGINTNFQLTTVGQNIIEMEATNACGTFSLIDTVEVYDEPSVTLNSIPDFCDTLEVTLGWNIDTGGLPTVVNLNPGVGSLLAGTTYQFTNTGQNSVILTATNSCGISADTFIFVGDTTPSVTLTAIPDTVLCLGDTVQIIATGAANYSWTSTGPLIGNAGPSVETYPSVNSNVTVLASNAAGTCDTTLSISLAVDTANSVNAGNDTVVCDSIPSFLLSGSSPPGGTWSGPGIVNSASGEFDPVVAGVGVHSLIYSDTNFNGCAASDTMEVTVSAAYQAQIHASDFCFGSPTNFADTTMPASVSRTWDFGDGSLPDTSQNPAHTYSSVATYQVTLMTEGPAGCFSSDTLPVTISDTPIASFTVSTLDSICVGDSVVVTSTSTGMLDTLIWDFGDGSPLGSGTADTHAYSTAGVYNIRLTAGIQASGCSSDTVFQITVLGRTQPAFTALPNSTCLGDSVQFTNTTPSYISHWWDLGDGNISQQINPNYTYSNPGIYSVQLFTENILGCLDSAEIDITIDSLPDPSFILDTVCLGDQTSFQATSPAQNWIWDFGDGTSVTGIPNPQHQYLTADTFTVCLTIVDSNCQDSLCQDVIVWANPSPAFAFDTVCFGDTTSFNSATGGIVQWDWNFGDGTTISSGASESHSYQNPPSGLLSYLDNLVYTVQLQVTDTNGCQATVMDSVLVNPTPQAGFTAGTECAGSPTEFIDTTLGNIVNWYWDFGDNSPIDTTSNPTQHIYSTGGTYLTTMVVSNIFGCSDSSANPVVVRHLPQAGFIHDTACLGDSTIFSNTTISVDPIDSICYDFGDGNLSFQPNTWNIYGASQTYSVQQISKTIYGCRDTSSVAVFVAPDPVADFNVVSNCPGQPAIFTDASQGMITQWFWDFDDNGATSTVGPITSHSYSQAGVYSAVKLLVETGFGCQDSIEKPVIISNALEVDFISSAPVCTDQSVNFYDSTVVFSGTIQSWLWDFGDGTTSNLQNPIHTYSQPGSYSVQLVVTLNSGCQDDITYSINVFSSPEASFTADTVCQGISAGFHDSSISADPIVSYFFDFGDGFSSGQSNPSHLYLNDSIYSAALIVTTSNGCSDTVANTVLVNPVPSADFLADTVCPGQATTFSDLSQGNITAWFWDFNDNGVLSTLGPVTSHTYSGAGTFPEVKLVVSNAFGCQDSIEKVVLVVPALEADFHFSGPACTGQTVSFFDSTTVFSGTIQSWQWDFGDNSVSSLPNPQHIYTSSGNYDVQLKVMNTDSCWDSITYNIVVFESPQAAFSAANVCQGAAVNVVDNTISSDPVASYLYTFSNGGVAVDPNPVVVFSVPGIIQATQIVTSINGCADTANGNLEVFPLPQVSFSFDTVCLGDTTTLVSQSNANHSGSFIVDWQWKFWTTGWISDNDSIYAWEFSSLTNNGVWHQVITDKGCQDSAFGLVPLFQDIQTAIVTLPDTQCFGTPVCFFDSTISASPIQHEWNLGDGSLVFVQDVKDHFYPAVASYEVQHKVTDTNGCYATDSKTVIVHPKPRADFTISKDMGFCEGSPIIFKDSSDYGIGTSNAILWQLDFDTISEEHQFEYYQEESARRLITLVVTNNYGCADTLNREVSFSTLIPVKYANAFSPNGDGLNDQFSPFTVSECVESFQFEVFDRWGKQIFFSNNQEDRWNGTYPDGKPCEMGVYAWKATIRFNNNSEEWIKTDEVKLLR